ncbi:DUF2167 domain-containing protein [Amphritea pacifica]|uniref:DUF2167 domain-containing protein n=1 Tax=Amphritea pacifica TaxID=2811233 RepID=UPI001E5ACF43|nr:DUF2167 domain-containing protein [Amphritea pacifica]
MKKIGIFLITLCLLISLPLRAEEQQLTPEQQQYILEARNLLDSLNHQTGKVALPNGVASLDVPDSFYYLSPEDSEKVLVDVWGNLPGTGSETLGMLLPSDTTPYDDNSWGVTIEYEEDGYVSDENADDLDYNELLEQMKKDAQEASKQRVAEGYEPIELIGWASPPYYDKTSNKLYWAKEIKFGSQELHTLNYNIRVLGRKGVLVLNFIAGMDQKSLIDSNLQTVLNMTEFNQGSRYEDFDPSIDKVAAYGIGALVAGKVIAKTGLIAAALIFLKKFGVLFIIGIGALFRKIFKKK